MNPFEMPDDIMDEMTTVFSIERNNKIIGKVHGVFCNSEYPSTIQLVENTDIRNGDWLIDTITNQRYYAKDAHPIIVGGEPLDWMVKYQTEQDFNQSMSRINQSVFNINSVSGNSIIGNQENAVQNIGCDLDDISQLIKRLPSSEQEEAENLLNELRDTEMSNHPILVEGKLSKFSKLLKNNSDLFSAVGRWAVQLLIGK